MPSNAVCTIIAKNYLAHARVLMESVRRHDPDVRRIVFLADRVDGYFDPSQELFDLILSEELDLPDSPWFHFKYSVMELSTALKPYALDFALRRFGLDSIVYLDADIQTFTSLNPIFEELRASSITLTPHLTAPLNDPLRPNELDILRSGAYNLGFIGVASRPETFRFLEWWQVRLADYCVVDLPRGLFVDQKWIDLVPGMFSRVSILRDPGYNVAYWNLAHRPLNQTPEGWQIDGYPLCFFHFSGADAEDDALLSKHQNRFFSLEALGNARILFDLYRQGLIASGYRECSKWPYAFGSFHNGVPIPDAGRSLKREAPQLAEFEDPFSDAACQVFVRLWNEPVAAPAGSLPGISRLAYKIYRTDDDLQAAMPDIFGGDYTRFLAWMANPGDSGLNLDAVFRLPAQDALASPAVPVSTPSPVQLTQLALLIYESRPDLHRILPDPSGRDGVKYLAWLLTTGRHQHHIPGAFLVPIQAEWERIVGAASPAERLWHRALLKGMGSMNSLKPYVARLTQGLGRITTAAPKFPPTQSSLNPGLNILGYFTAETGVGQASRSLARAAKAGGLEISLKAIRVPGPERTGDGDVSSISEHLPHRVNVLRVNADQIPHAFSELDPYYWLGRYNIGYWAWELDEFPDRWLHSFAYLDEVWVPSSFCQDAVARKSLQPVVRMPYGVHLSLEGSPNRSDFGWATDEFIFLVVFDMLSVFQRKNPIAVVRAFQEAFGDGTLCRLVIHVNHADQDPDSMALLRQYSSPAITILDKPLSRPGIKGLINSCDCLVSLHRSEGFGWTMAEAMYLGKPVIATGYSGNMDFTRAGHAFLVEYRLVPVGLGCDPYDPLSVWADAEISHAARQMQIVAGQPELRRDVAARGQALIHSEFDPKVVGRIIRSRLERIHKPSTEKEKSAAG